MSIGAIILGAMVIVASCGIAAVFGSLVDPIVPPDPNDPSLPFE